MKKIIVFIGLMVLCISFVSATNITYNYVYNGSDWIPWISTTDGKPKVDLNLLNISAGTASINGNVSINSGYLVFPDGSKMNTVSSSSSLWTNSSGNLTFTGGNVGIGTTSPYRKLHVNGSGNILGIFESYTTAGGIRLTDTTNYFDIYSNEGNFDIVEGGATTRMRIDSSGNVGVGTTNPSYKLDVIGTSRFGKDSALPSGLSGKVNIIGDDATGIITANSISSSGNPNVTFYIQPDSNTNSTKMGTFSSSGLDLRVGNSNVMLLNTDGDVGIGVTNPDEILTIQDTGGSPAIIKVGTASASDGFTRIYGYGDSAGFTISGNADVEGELDGSPNNATLDYTGRDGWAITGFSAGGIGEFSVDYYSAGAGEREAQTRLMIDANGNVGMGTTSPTTKLTLQGTTLISSGIMFNNTNAGNWRIGPGSAGFTFQNATDNAIKMVINSNGAVGIGTNDPVTVGGTKLNVYGSSPRVLISDNSGTSSILELSSFPTSAYIQTRTSSQTLYIGTANANRISISGSTGEVTLSTLGTGTVYSNSGLLTNTNPSDIRLKKNIENITNSLEKVNQLRPVTFKWNNTNISSVGFIAQEVNETLPNLVEKNSDGYLGLKTTEFIPYLTQAIKELKEENVALKKIVCRNHPDEEICQ